MVDGVMSVAKPKKRKGKMSKLSKAIWAVVFLYAGYVFVQQQIQLSQLKNEAEALEAHIAEAQELNTSLEETAASIGTDEFIEQVARQRLGFVKPDEQVFIDTSK